jgi:hypothetical protein
MRVKLTIDGRPTPVAGLTGAAKRRLDRTTGWAKGGATCGRTAGDPWGRPVGASGAGPVGASGATTGGGEGEGVTAEG